MSESATLTIRLNHKIKQRLDKIAQQDRRTKSFLAAEAVDAYVRHREWWEETIAKARASDYASEEDMNAFFDKWAE
jgi:predicted transcriptional regulator